MIDVEEMKRFLGGDDEFITHLMKKFILETGADLEKLKTAVSEKKIQMVRAMAHKMLSSTRIFNIDELSSRLEKIEISAEGGIETHKIPGLVNELEFVWKKVIVETKKIQEKFAE